MRGRLLLVLLVGSALGVTLLSAQQPGGAQPTSGAPQGQQQPQVNPALAAQRLDEILDSWSMLNGSAQSVYAHFLSEKKYNHLAGQVKRFWGEAKFLKLPDGVFGANIGQHEYDQQGQYKKDCYEKFIFTGGYLYMFDPMAKELLVQTMPPRPAGAPPEDGPMPFCIFLLKKQEAKKRFDLRVNQIDANYTYVEVWPKFPADKQEFIFARLVVMNQDVQVKKPDNSGQTYVPIPKNLIRELYWVEPNKAEVKWDMKVIEVNSPKVARNDVANPDVPPGWKRTNYQAPRQPGPGVPGGAAIGTPTKVIRP